MNRSPSLSSLRHGVHRLAVRQVLANAVSPLHEVLQPDRSVRGERTEWSRQCISP